MIDQFSEGPVPQHNLEDYDRLLAANTSCWKQYIIVIHLFWLAEVPQYREQHRLERLGKLIDKIGKIGTNLNRTMEQFDWSAINKDWSTRRRQLQRAATKLETNLARLRIHLLTNNETRPHDSKSGKLPPSHDNGATVSRTHQQAKDWYFRKASRYDWQ